MPTGSRPGSVELAGLIGAGTVRDERERPLVLADLLQSMSVRFINQSVEEIGPAIEEALGELCRFLGGDRALIIVLSELLHRPPDAPSPNDVMTMAHEWRRDGVVPSLDEHGLLKIHPESPTEARRANEWFREFIRSARSVCWSSLSDIPSELGFLRRRWELQSVKSRVGVPMMIEGTCVGLLGVDHVQEERVWGQEAERSVRAAATIFAHAVLRKQNAEAIQEAHDTLERRVEERTRELRQKQAQLVQSEKLASLGQLVAGVAHEVNNPLGAIKSNHDISRRAFERIAEMVRDEDATLEPKDVDRLRTIVESTAALAPGTEDAIDRIATLVTSLRSFARLDRADVDRVELRAGLESTLAMLRPELDGRVDVTVDFADIPLVVCVANQINQVFMNVLLNASQAIDGSGTITVRAAVDGDCVRLTFHDTGRGIAAEDLARVFDPGFTKRGVGVGTGLGMSIVHQVVQDHGGDVSVVSPPGEGTTVIVRLPLDHRTT